MGFGYYYFDWTYILVIIGLVLSLIAQGMVKSAFNKYQRVMSKSGITAADAAQQILYRAGISDVRVAHISGSLTDNYDPSNQVLHLSDSTINSRSIAAIGVAAHECGHAMQHSENYGPLGLRSALVPATKFGQTISWPLIVVGFLINGQIGDILLLIGIIAFSLAVLFSLVTLPVEFNASSRAVRVLSESGMMDQEEVAGVKKVLNAAALTYVAAAASSALSLLRILLLANGRRRR